MLVFASLFGLLVFLCADVKLVRVYMSKNSGKINAF